MGDIARHRAELALAEASLALNGQEPWLMWIAQLRRHRESLRASLETATPDMVPKIQGACQVVSGLLRSNDEAQSRVADLRSKLDRLGGIVSELEQADLLGTDEDD